MSLLTRTVVYAGFELRRLLRLPAVMAFLLGPIVFYPTLIWLELQAFTLIEGTRTSQHYEVGADDAEIVDALEASKRATPTTGTLDALRDGDIDAYVTRDGTAVQVHTLARRPRSSNAGSYVQMRLQRFNRDAIEAAFLDAGGEASAYAAYEAEDAKRGEGNTLLLELVAFVLAFMTPMSVIISATHPANVVFVSDREELTAETLAVSAVPRAVLVGGKLLAVTAMQVMAGLANLVVLYLAAVQGLTLMEISGSAPVPTVGDAVIATLALTSFGLLISLVCATCLIPLRTYKEAQNVGAYGVLLALGPLMLCGFSLTTTTPEWMWAVPIGHTTLLLDALLRDTLTPWHAVLVATTDLGLAAAWLGLLWITPGPTGLLAGAWRPPWLGRLLGDP